MSTIYLALITAYLLFNTSCSPLESGENPLLDAEIRPIETQENLPKIRNGAKIIHVLVALCDNENQGIVPVPASLGNGDDPKRNLYWGAAYGVKTYFSKSNSWKKIDEIQSPKSDVLERLVFKHRRKNVYLIADAYRGIKIKNAIMDFLSATSGQKRENIEIEGKTFQIFASADVITFVGHNGLMDFDLDKNKPINDPTDDRSAIILACLSKKYFTIHLKQTNTKPLLWTSNLMAPEAYILHDSLEGWIKGENNEKIRNRAANAYSKYQKISLKSAKRLLVTGW